MASAVVLSSSAANLVNTFKMSMTMLSKVCSCFDLRLSKRSSTISLTLLSDSLTINSAYAPAAASQDVNGVNSLLTITDP